MEHIQEIQSNLIGFIESSEPQTLVEVLILCSDKYYNTNESLITDEEYDRLYEKLEEIDPKNKYLEQVGSIVEGEKVELPYWIGSMNKKKTQEEVDKWIPKYPGEVVISDKLDGKSFILDIKDGTPKLYSRGNGNLGKDISYLLKYINIPELGGNYILRGEILISKTNFKRTKTNAANSRSFIAGISNLKKIDKDKSHDLKLVDLICFEVISPEMKPSEQFSFLKDKGFKVVFNQIKPEISFKSLQEILKGRKEDSEYDIDGIIVCQNNIYPRSEDKNPKHAIAFKMDMEFAISKVIDIEWNLSKHGKLKPLVLIEPVSLNATTVKAATGNNAAFIVKHKLGPGCQVKIKKSGEIIPKIVEVYGGTEPKMPECDYEWNSTEKEILAVGLDENDDVKIKRITCFFKTIGVEHIGPGIYKKMYEHGYDTIKKIMDIKKEQLLELPGIKEKSANNILGNLNNILDKPVSVGLVVAGSCILGTGLGVKILQKILVIYPNIFSQEIEVVLETLLEIPSIEKKTATRILDKLTEIRQFIQNHPRLKLEIKKKKKIIRKKKTTFITDKNIVITGKRDKEILDYIEKNSGKIQGTINSKTNILIAEDKEGKSSKLKKAKELGIEIMDFNEFKQKML